MNGVTVTQLAHVAGLRFHSSGGPSTEIIFVSGEALALDRFAELVAEHERKECASIAISGCLVPPDGGSPTREEIELCDAVARMILDRGKQEKV